MCLFFIPAGTQGATAYQCLVVQDGNIVTFPCYNYCDNSVTWRFRGLRPGAEEVELFSQGQEKATSDRLSVYANCSVVIHKVTVEDAGYYTCRVADKTMRTPGFLLEIDLAVVVSEYFHLQYLFNNYKFV